MRIIFQNHKDGNGGWYMASIGYKCLLTKIYNLESSFQGKKLFLVLITVTEACK